MSLSDDLRLHRRAWLRCAGGVAAAAGLSACGFELRRTPAMSFSSIALSGFPPHSLLAAELREALSPTVRVVESPAQAQVVLQVLRDVRERVAVATTSAAQVRELTLRLKFTFRLHTPDGRELMPASPLELSRDMSYNETAALAKEIEANDLYREMQTDAVVQVLRRLSTVRL